MKTINASELDPTTRYKILKAVKLQDIQKTSRFGSDQWEAASKILGPLYAELAEINAPHQDAIN